MTLPPSFQPHHVSRSATPGHAQDTKFPPTSPGNPATDPQRHSPTSPGHTPRSTANPHGSAIPLGTTPAGAAPAPAQLPPSIPAGSLSARRAREAAGYPATHAASATHATSAKHPTPQPTPQPSTPGRKPRKPLGPRSLARRTLSVLLVLLLVTALWGLYLVHRVDSGLGRVEALTETGLSDPAAATTAGGATWLLVGSDSREGTAEAGAVEGQRSDTVILVHRAPNGQAAVISLPRDSFVDIPGYSANKLNAAYSWGGPALLVATVQELTGLRVDHYVEIGFTGVSRIVDALGGVELCWEHNANDQISGFQWQAGCHQVDGNYALLFSRMRYSDPEGDIGRTQRQRHVISQVLKKALSPANLVLPWRQVSLADAGAAALRVDPGTGVFDILGLVLALRKAGADGLQGTPPIANVAYAAGPAVGSAVKLDENALPGFLQALREGTLSTQMLQPQQ